MLFTPCAGTAATVVAVLDLRAEPGRTYTAMPYATGTIAKKHNRPWNQRQLQYPAPCAVPCTVQRAASAILLYTSTCIATPMLCQKLYCAATSNCNHKVYGNSISQCCNPIQVQYMASPVTPAVSRAITTHHTTTDHPHPHCTSMAIPTTTDTVW